MEISQWAIRLIINVKTYSSAIFLVGISANKIYVETPAKHLKRMLKYYEIIDLLKYVIFSLYFTIRNNMDNMFIY